MTRRSPFAGRAAQLETLEAALDAVLSGERRAVAIGGRPGAGRSRLLDEFELRLATSDVGLRRAEVFPAWATHPDALADALELDDLDDDQTTVLLIDDAHHADRGSLGRIRQLLLSSRENGLLVVLTHRPVDEADAPTLHRLFEALADRGALDRTTMGPLTSADVAEVVDGPAADEVAERLIATSGGWPVALQERVDDLVGQGHLRLEEDRLVAVHPPEDWPATRTLRERVAELQRDARTLVESAALAGEPLSLDLVFRLLDRDADDALDLGERLVDQGLLSESTAGFHPRTNAEADELAADIGEVRRTRLLGQLADAATATGLADSRPGLVGRYHLRAGAPDRAFPLLAEAGLDAARREAYAEAMPLVSGALEALERVRDVDPQLEGELRFARARCHRMLGRSDLAEEDADVAARLLDTDGQARLRGWQAQIADDAQEASRGEWLTALAELASAQQGDLAGVGRSLTLRAKMLGRLGLAEEADACLRRGIRLLRLHGDGLDRFHGHWNGAWLAFDRGQVGLATSGFEYCAHHAAGFEGEEWLAQSEAWRARSLLWAGRVDEAIDARDRALESAARTDSLGPVFLAALGTAEGMWLLGRHDEALEAADEALDIVLRQIPVWENVVRYWRTSALLGRGDVEEAAREAERALAACPDGPDGDRWRSACLALVLEVTAATDDPWPTGEAAELVRTLVRARWFAAAVRLLIARATREDDPDQARRAAALAHELGVPLLAARALDAGDLWDGPIAPAIVAAVLDVADHLPDGWDEDRGPIPWVATASEQPESGAADRLDSTRALEPHRDDALLVGGVVAEDLRAGPREWSEPLPRVRTPEEDRRRRVGALLAVGAAVLVLGGAAIGGILRTSPTDDATPPVVADEPSGGHEIIAATGDIIGSWTHRGGPARNAVADRDAAGISRYDGLYWEPVCTGSPIRSSPIVRGNFAYFGSGENLYAVDLATGQQVWRQPTDGEIRAAPAVAGGVGEGGLAGADTMLFAASRDGVLHAWTTTGEVRWAVEIADRIESAPLVVDEVVYVGTHDGYLHAFDGASGEELWRFPDDEPIGTIRSSPTLADDLIVFGDDDGHVYAIDLVTGSELWRGSTGDAVVDAAAYHDGVVYATSLGQTVWAFDAASGRLDRVGTYRTDRQLGASPAIDGGALFVPSNVRLIAIDLDTGDVRWSLRTDAAVASAPVIAGDVIYVGSDDGRLYAVDRTDGATDREPLWSFETGGAISASPALADGAVLVGSTDGCLYALGEAPEPLDEPEDEETPSG